MLCEARLSAGQLEELEAGLVKGEELVQSFKEKRATQRLHAEGWLVTNMEKAQRTMERYIRWRCTIITSFTCRRSARIYP